MHGWLPHGGPVEVVPARGGDVLLRIPGRVDPRTLEVTVNGATRTVDRPGGPDRGLTTNAPRGTAGAPAPSSPG